MGCVDTLIHVEEFCSSGGNYDPSLSGQEGLSSICPFKKRYSFTIRPRYDTEGFFRAMQ